MDITEELIVLQDKIMDVRNRICLEGRKADPQIMNMMHSEILIDHVIEMREEAQ